MQERASTDASSRMVATVVYTEVSKSIESGVYDFLELLDGFRIEDKGKLFRMTVDLNGIDEGRERGDGIL